MSSSLPFDNTFTSYGTLRAHVIEGIDLISTDNLLGLDKHSNKSNYSVYATVRITNDKEDIFHSYSTNIYPCYKSESVLIDEEFIFEKISSVDTLVITLYLLINPIAAIGSHTNNILVSSGFTRIPLYRLEENKKIQRWHQVMNPINSSEGLRSAVRIECEFVSDGRYILKPASKDSLDTISKIKESILSSNISMRSNSQRSVDSNTNNEMMFPYHSFEEDDEDDDDDDDVHIDNDERSNNEQTDIIIKNTPTNINNERIFLKKNTNTTMKSNQPNNEKIIFDNHSNSSSFKEISCPNTPLEVGIIDYCAVFGPTSPFTIMQPSHYITNTGIITSIPFTRNHHNQNLPSDRYINNQKNYHSNISYKNNRNDIDHDKNYENNQFSSDNIRTNNNHNDNYINSNNNNINNSNNINDHHQNYTGNSCNSSYGLFYNNDNANDNSEEEQEIVMWDRLPRHNHCKDIELPSKIEWFACPEGSKTVLYPNRPNPFFQSFVLSSGGETEEIFGLSINFFMALYNSKRNPETDLPSCSTIDMLSSEGCNNNFNEYNNSSSTKTTSTLGNNYYNIDINKDNNEIPWWRQQIPYSNINDKNNLNNENKNILEKYTRNDKNDLQLWTAVSFCVLFRSSHHIQQLKECLEIGYYESILPNLILWEENWKELSQQESTIEEKEGFNFKILKSFSLCMEKLMATLCLECPMPIPGFLKVSIKLKLRNKLDRAKCKSINISSCNNDKSLIDKDSRNKSTLEYDKCKQDMDMKEIEFYAPPSEDFPRCPYGIEILLKCFGPRLLIDIVCCVLSESRILFHSTDLSLLPVICEGLRTLIYPLQWSHVYLPVLPMQLLSVVEAPVPFMLGTHTKWLKHIQIEYMQDMVLIDCDTASIDMGGSTALHFPVREDRWLMMALKTILQPILLNDDLREIEHPFIWEIEDHKELRNEEINFNSNTLNTTDHHVIDPATQIQLVFYDVLFHLLRYVPDCLFYLNPTCPVFNRPLFISDYASEEYKPALELITLTSCFHVLTESIHSPSLAFFYENITRLNKFEKGLVIDKAIAESTQPQSNAPFKNLRSHIFNDSLMNLQTPFIEDHHHKSSSPSMRASTDQSSSIINDRYDPLSDTLSKIEIPASIESINENAYSGLFPIWILRHVHEKRHQDYNPKEIKVQSIRKLLNNRFEYYQPYLKNNNKKIKNNEEKNNINRQNFDQENSLFHFTNEIESSNRLYHLIISTDYSVGLKEILKNSTLKRNEVSRSWKILRNHILKDQIIQPKLLIIVQNVLKQYHKNHHYLIEFDDELISIAQNHLKRWTVGHLADELNIPIDTMLILYNQNRCYYASSKLGENTQFAARRRSMKQVNKSNQKEINLESTNVFDSMDHYEHYYNDIDRKCDECITLYLQKVVTDSNIDEKWAKAALIESLRALYDSNNRKNLIIMLKNAHHSREDKRELDSNVYPLNPEAFEAFSKLFHGVLQICSEQKDYICAFGLLEVGGLYFRFTDTLYHKQIIDNKNEEETDMMEFLSERAYQHPIYHTSALWLEIMKNRISIPNHNSMNQEINRNIDKTSEKKIFATKVINEVSFLLYIMLELEVNEARTLTFIKEISSLYGLELSDYYKMEQRIKVMWNNETLNVIVDPINNHLIQQQEHKEVVEEEIKIGDKNKNILEESKSKFKSYLSPNGLSKKSRDITNIWKLLKNHMLQKNDDDIKNHPKLLPEKNKSNDFDNNNIDDDDDDDDENSYNKNEKDIRSNSDNNSNIQSTKNDIFQTPTIKASNKLNEDYSPIDSIEYYPNHLQNLASLNKHYLKVDINGKSNSNKSLTLSLPDDNNNQQEEISLVSKTPESNSPDFHVSTKSTYSISPTNLLKIKNHSSSEYSNLHRKDSPRNLLIKSPSFNIKNTFSSIELKGKVPGFVTQFDCMGKWLVAGTDSGSIHIADMTTNTFLKQMQHSTGKGETYRGITAIHCMKADISSPNSKNSDATATTSFSMEENLCFSGCSNGIIKIWGLNDKIISDSMKNSLSSSSFWNLRKSMNNLSFKQSIASIKVHKNPITVLNGKSSLATSGSGWLLASGDSSGGICISKGNENSSSSTITTVNQIINSSSYTTATAATTNIIPSLSINHRYQSISCLAFLNSDHLQSNDSYYSTLQKSNLDEFLIIGNASGTIAVLDILTAIPVYQIDGHRGNISKIIALNSNEFITCSSDRTIKIWDIRVKLNSIASNKLVSEKCLGYNDYRKCGSGMITCLSIGGQENQHSLIISASSDGITRVWDRRYDLISPCSITQAHYKRITSMIWNNAKDDYITASLDGLVKTWDSTRSINSYNSSCCTSKLRAYEDDGIIDMKVVDSNHNNKQQLTRIITNSWSGELKCFISNSIF